MKKLQKGLYSAIVVSEFSHIFCCVLPTIFSVVSLLAGIGMVTAVPLWLESIHSTLHGWEIPMIAMSGFLVALGWVLDAYSKKIDCHDTGCGHGPCGPTKNKAHTILKFATVLFFVNISIYMVFHRGMEVFVPAESGAVVSHQHAEDHNH